MKSDKWVILNAREESGRIVLEPHSNFDRERVQKRMKNGRGQIRASLASVRSLPQLRLYWPWIRLVVENSQHFTTERGLHLMLLTACGVVEPLMTLEGDMRLIPSSIAFDAMDQEDFDLYFNKAQQIVSERIIPGVDLVELMNQSKKETGWDQHPNNKKPARSSAGKPTDTMSPSSSDLSPKPSSSASTRSSSSSAPARRAISSADATPYDQAA